MDTNENRRQGRHSLHGGVHHTKDIGEITIGRRLVPCSSPLRVPLKRVIIRLALAGILSPELATRLLSWLGLVPA